MEDFILNIAAVLALVLPVFSVWAAISLFRLSRANPRVTALRERSRTAGILALTSVFGGFVGLHRIYTVTVGDSLLPREVCVILLVLIILLTSVPNVLWALGYKMGDLNGPE